MKGLEQFAQMSCNIGLDDTTLRTIFAALDDDGSGTLDLVRQGSSPPTV
jgi:hypothetical protein